jgi:hypothetical protein
LLDGTRPGSEPLQRPADAEDGDGGEATEAPEDLEDADIDMDADIDLGDVPTTEEA